MFNFYSNVSICCVSDYISLFASVSQSCNRRLTKDFSGRCISCSKKYQLHKLRIVISGRILLQAYLFSHGLWRCVHEPICTLHNTFIHLKLQYYPYVNFIHPEELSSSLLLRQQSSLQKLLCWKFSQMVYSDFHALPPSI